MIFLAPDNVLAHAALGYCRQAYEHTLALDPDMEDARRGLMALEVKKVARLYFY
ncbi:MAG: hypothetical protein IME96_09425 [Proteobacteria bacterium]|nr:hypothetical protein [Pseudomonadota bacterium]